MATTLTHRLAAIACAGPLMISIAGQVSAGTTPASTVVPSSQGAVSGERPATLTLSDAFEIARRSHPDLRVADADLNVLRADSTYARVPAFNPTVEFQSTRGGPSLGSGSESTLDLGVSQELDLGGKRAARQAVASARARTGAAEWSATLQAIESNVRVRFEHALFLQDRLLTLDGIAALDRRVVASSQARVRDGSMTPVTGRLTELDLFRLEAQAQHARADVRQALVALGLSIGIAIPDSTRLAGALQADSLVAPEDSIVALALSAQRTGDVLREHVAVRRAELRLAEREALPDLTLGLGVARERRGFSRHDFAGDPAVIGGIAGVRSTDNLWTARVSMPLAFRQKNQAGRARAAVEISRSEADYDRYRLRTQLAVRGAVQRFEDSAALYRLYLDRSVRVRQDLVLIREAYADGRIPLDSYLTQKGRLVDTLLGELEAASAYWDARGDLESAVGLDLDHINAGGAR